MVKVGFLALSKHALFGSFHDALLGIDFVQHLAQVYLYELVHLYR